MIEMAVPIEIYPQYSPAIDRFDVAIRAVLKLFRRRQWDCLNELGISREEHETDLSLGDLYVEDMREDQQIAALLARCPFVLGAALELLRRYAVLTAQSRKEWLRGAKNDERVSYLSGGRGRGGAGAHPRYGRARG